MTQQDQVESGIRGDGWAADHAREYVKSDGKEGHIWRGVPTLLLTTTGRRSGEPYTTPLIYGENDGRYLVVASKGGAPQHPDWYRNLVAQPEVGLQVGGERFRARARPAGPTERPALWKQMAAIWPDYEKYQQRTEREIPVIILERS